MVFISSQSFSSSVVWLSGSSVPIDETIGRLVS
ncbi:unnamed protein product [Linum tenue]|uniref:Uncharacterized protein n=1 Tax=Linum tenue TaxID=586396 RepID=A0AAV0QBT0_9ROSI|nr:unnamed protein product [Linum tenue]